MNYMKTSNSSRIASKNRTTIKNNLLCKRSPNYKPSWERYN